MKKLSILIVCLLLISGCSMKGLIAEIPTNEFKEFRYHRGGNATSATIIAREAIKEGNLLMIQTVDITADYGPFASFTLFIEGLIIDTEEVE